MPSEFEDFLTDHKQRHASITPEGLELMGKEAANLYLDKHIPLNESISKLAGAHPDISSEQIKRIVEFANQSTYLAIHDKNKLAKAESSYPQFVVAEAGRIIQDLSDGARPTAITQTDLDYARQPLKKTAASKEQKSDNLLQSLFKLADIVPDLDYDDESIQNELYRTKYDLEDLKQALASAGETLDLTQQETEEEYYQAIKTHLLSGRNFSDVTLAAKSTGADNEKIASVFEPIIERLLKEKVATAKQLRLSNLEKTADRAVNPEHPLVTCLAGILTAEEEITKVAMSLEEVTNSLKRVNLAIKEFNASQTS